MSTERIDPLALDSQVCFALAVASREVVGAYRAVLEPMGLTHPQYLVMLALWEHERLTVRGLADVLHLKASTVTPLLQRLQERGMLAKQRSPMDERVVDVSLTDEGRKLRTEALAVPVAMLERLEMTEDELVSVNKVLHRIIAAAESAT